MEGSELASKLPRDPGSSMEDRAVTGTKQILDLEEDCLYIKIHFLCRSFFYTAREHRLVFHFLMGDRSCFLSKRNHQCNGRYPDARLQLINRISVTRHFQELIRSCLALSRMSFFHLTLLQIKNQTGERGKQLHASLGLDCDLFGMLFVETKCNCSSIFRSYFILCLLAKQGPRLTGCHGVHGLMMDYSKQFYILGYDLLWH